MNNNKKRQQIYSWDYFGGKKGTHWERHIKEGELRVNISKLGDIVYAVWNCHSEMYHVV